MKPKFAMWIALAIFGFFAINGLLYLVDSSPDYSNRIVEVEVDGLMAALQQYHMEFKAFPPGDSVEIQKALQGGNPRGLPFFQAGSRSLNNKGELLDPWGTPYRFTFSSTNRVVVTSAGKNRIFGDKDDVTRESIAR